MSSLGRRASQEKKYDHKTTTASPTRTSARGRPDWATMAVLVAVLFEASVATSLNLDLDHVLVFGGSDDDRQSEFGASAILHNYDNKAWALFGAPRARTNDIVTGVVYRCEIANRAGGSCQHVFDSSYRLNQTVEVNSVQMKMSTQNMSFGLTMAYDQKNQFMSVCAPRHTLHFQNGPSAKDLAYFVLGSCFVFSRDFTPYSVMINPNNNRFEGEELTILDKNRVTRYLNSMRQLGSSLAIKDGRYLLGAPGYYDWTGKSTVYDSPSDQYCYDTTPVEANENSDLAGYAVDQMTINNNLYFVHGAPRRNNVRGEVIIITPGGTPFADKTIRIAGTQTGEYFGAAVAVADVNGDGFDDLLVGAPFFSPTEETPSAVGGATKKLNAVYFDRGAVYVYHGQKTELEKTPSILVPDSSSVGGRFGMTITNLGDLDKDGSDDIAVSAPFEPRSDGGSGAVYVFKGSFKNGLSNGRRLRVEPPSTTPVARGFGFSVSQGLDLTGNGYPDFSVGSVLSGHGFIFRSRPVVLLEASISANQLTVPQTGGNCSALGRHDLFCFNINACAAYHYPLKGTIPRETYPLFVNLYFQADPYRSNSRGFIAGPDSSRVGTSQTHKVKLEAADIKSCIDVKAFVTPSTKDGDILTPVEFRMSYDIDDSRSSSELDFCSDCPVLESATNVSTRIAYKVNCKHEGCLVRLDLDAKIVGFANNSEISLGRRDPLELKIDVQSASGSDIAFRTEVEIKLRNGFKFNNPDKCTRVGNKEDIVSCVIDNQMEAGSSKSISVKLQLDTELDPSAAAATLVGFEVILKTASIDENARKNRRMFEFALVNRADVGLSGTGLVEIVLFNKTTSAVAVEHTYTVTKYHESQVDSVILSVDVPVARKVDRIFRYPFIEFVSSGASSFSSEVGSNCTQAPLRRKRRSAPESASLTLPPSSIRQLNVDCDSFACVRLTCVFGPFIFDQSRAAFQMKMIFNISKLIEQVRATPEHILYTTSANISMTNREQFTIGKTERAKQAEIVTNLVREGRPLGRGVAWWWLLLAVIVGLLVVSLMFYILYRCGFFKRHSREDLRELQREPHSSSPILNVHSPINNMVDVDDNDNDATFHDSKV